MKNQTNWGLSFGIENQTEIESAAFELSLTTDLQTSGRLGCIGLN